MLSVSLSLSLARSLVLCFVLRVAVVVGRCPVVTDLLTKYYLSFIHSFIRFFPSL